MSKCYFYNKEILNGFKFPKSFLEFMDNDERLSLEPWYFLCEFKENAIFWFDEAKRQYPKRVLVPFARCDGTDDISCFDGNDTTANPKVYFVHFFASEGWEDRGSVKDFDKWLKIIEEEVKDGNL